MGKRGRSVKNLSEMPSLVKNSSKVQRETKQKREKLGYRRNTLVKKKNHSSSSESGNENNEGKDEDEDKDDSGSFEEKSPKKVQKESTPKKVRKESTDNKGKGGVGRRR